MFYDGTFYEMIDIFHDGFTAALRCIAALVEGNV